MQLAELNIGYMAYPVDDPRMAEFMDNLDRINALAERSPGFVWRLKSDSGNATDIFLDEFPGMNLNLSVWEDVASLGHYVFNTVHARFYERRDDWFKLIEDHHVVMWWVPDGHVPTPQEAMKKLAHLRAHGPSDEAFGWDYVDQSAWRRCALAAE